MLGGADNLNGELLSYIIGADSNKTMAAAARPRPEMLAFPLRYVIPAPAWTLW